MISNHLGMVEALRPASNELAEAVEQFLAAGGTVAQLPSPPRKPLPPPRSTKIDPETILKRRKPPITRAEREALRKLAEAL